MCLNYLTRPNEMSARRVHFAGFFAIIVSRLFKNRRKFHQKIHAYRRGVRRNVYCFTENKTRYRDRCTFSKRNGGRKKIKEEKQLSLLNSCGRSIGWTFKNEKKKKKTMDNVSIITGTAQLSRVVDGKKTINKKKKPNKNGGRHVFAKSHRPL